MKKEHTWEWDDDQEKFRCTSCLTSTKSLYGRKAKCAPLSPESRGHILGFWANGHRLRSIKGRKGNQLMVFCGKCGRYASGKGDKLNQLCPGQPMRKATLSRLLEGRHPEKGYHLGEVTILSVAGPGVYPSEERHREQGQTPDEPKESAADPMQELEELEKALERYQVEFEERPGESNGVGDEDWEMQSSGSE